MTALPSPLAFRVEAEDVAAGFRCGKRSLDDFFARHALANDQKGIGCTYVLRREEGDPAGAPEILGYYTLSMGLLASAQVSLATNDSDLPRYPMPVGLIGKLAADERTKGLGLRVGETLLMDAIVRILRSAETIGCVGVAVDALDDAAESFYRKYQFVTVDDSKWPRKMFLPLRTALNLFQ